MGDTLQQIDGNCRFRGIIRAERNAHTLNSRLTHQAADVGFLYSYCMIDFLLCQPMEVPIGRCVKHQASANSINRWRNLWNGAA